MKYKFLILNLIGLLYTQNLNAATSGNCGPKNANGEYTDSCTFTYSDGTLTISGTGKMADWGTVNGSTTYKFDDERPWNDFIPQIENVVISGISNVGARAFANASSLKNITIPEGVTSIGYGAFVHTYDLTSVTIPDSVTYIGTSAFYGDNKLENIILSENSNLQTIDNYAFSGLTSLTNISLPDGLKNIGVGVFESVNHLTDIIIPNETSIGISAFIKLSATIYCTINTDCLTGTAAHIDNIIPYTKDQSGAYALLDEDGNIITDAATGNPIYYLSADDMTTQANPCTSGYDSCATQALNARAQSLADKGKVCNSFENCQALVYADYNGEVIKVGGKDYASLSDLLKGKYMPKRIYTLEEANAVAGEKNRVSIKYR